MKKEHTITIARGYTIENKQEAIKKSIIQQIKRKELTGKVPGIQKLARLYNANPKTVNKAILSLVEEGILLRYGKEGTFVPPSSSRKQTRNIFFLSGVVKELEESDPYYTEIFEGIRQELNKYGYMLTLSNIHHINLRNLHTDGVIIEGIGPKGEHLIELENSKIPFLLLDRYSDEKDYYPWIAFDYAFGIEEAVNHLLDQELYRILYIGGLSEYWAGANRIQGYIQAFEKKKIPYSRDLIFQRDYSIATGYDAVSNTRKKGINFDAVLCGGFHITLGAIRALKEAKLVIGKDLALVGFLDPPLAAHMSPSLTTIQLPLRKIGVRAAKTVLQMIKTGDSPKKNHLLLPKLIVRDSSSIRS
ncbi:MAG: substrate-binding domain-containing protein [Candidatus Ratteibacteria bacterium]|jgi:DNA-binding LacI/PurR family transcriptional regulator